MFRVANGLVAHLKLTSTRLFRYGLLILDEIENNEWLYIENWLLDLRNRENHTVLLERIDTT